MSSMDPNPASPTFLDEWVLGEIRSFLESNPPRVSIQRATGRSLVVADPQYVDAEENTSSTTYVDLTTVGPQMDQLPAGRYIFWFGASQAILTPGPATRASMALSINGSTPSAPETSTGTAQASGASIVQFEQLDQDSNLVVCQYKTSDASHASYFGKRYLACLRYSD